MNSKFNTNSNIPKLRFPEFSGEGSEHNLGDLVKIYDGTHQTPNYVKEGVPFYSVEHVTADEFTKTKFISPKVFEHEIKRVRIEKNDILMTRIGDIGTSKLIDWDVKASFYVSLALIKGSNKINSCFLVHYINTNNFQKELWRRTLHVAFPKKINLGEIGRCVVTVPNSLEQQKIASFLESVDSYINNLKSQKESLEEYKKGIMQQIFAQEVRFKDENGKEFPDWEKKKLGEVCSINKGEQLNKDRLLLEGNYPCQNGGVEPSGFTNSFNTKANTITISEGGNSCGHINYQKTDFWAGGHCYSLLEIDTNVEKLFLFQNLKYNQNQIMKLRVGSGLPNIQKKDISKLKINLPSLPEQQKIASFFSSIDDQIELKAQQIEKAEEWKKGLMQGLFV